jgi:hypothetical protein
MPMVWGTDSEKAPTDPSPAATSVSLTDGLERGSSRARPWR